MKSIHGWILGAAVVGGLYAWAVSAAKPQGSDEVQIRSAIVTAARDLNAGRTRSVMALVSPDYKDSTGLNRTQLNLLARRATANQQYWDSSLRALNTSINGDEATADVSLRITTKDTGSTRDVRLGLTMRRENTHYLGLIPTQRWRVTGISGIPDEALGLTD